MEILGVYNIKGGVGKTTTAVNLAYISAAQGWRTVLWDLDPQGAATYILKRKPKIKGGVKNLVRGDTRTPDLVRPTDYPGLGLLPSDFSYRHMDQRFGRKKHPIKQLQKLMAPLHRKHACMILDCAPGMSLVSENVLHSVDALIVPLTPSPLSVRTLHQLIDFLDGGRSRNIQVLPFFSMLDTRKKLHKDTARYLRAEFPLILETEIPYGAAFEQVAVRRAPIEAFSPRSPAAAVYRSLWEEIDHRLAKEHELGEPAPVPVCM